jgi:hypothetical protein
MIELRRETDSLGAFEVLADKTMGRAKAALTTALQYRS